MRTLSIAVLVFLIISFQAEAGDVCEFINSIRPSKPDLSKFRGNAIDDKRWASNVSFDAFSCQLISIGDTNTLECASKAYLRESKSEAIVLYDETVSRLNTCSDDWKTENIDLGSDAKQAVSFYSPKFGGITVDVMETFNKSIKDDDENEDVSTNEAAAPENDTPLYIWQVSVTVSQSPKAITTTIVEGVPAERAPSIEFCNAISLVRRSHQDLSVLRGASRNEGAWASKAIVPSFNCEVRLVGQTLGLFCESSFIDTKDSAIAQHQTLASQIRTCTPDLEVENSTLGDDRHVHYYDGNGTVVALILESSVDTSKKKIKKGWRLKIVAAE
jgi:hypothetical protein